MGSLQRDTALAHGCSEDIDWEMIADYVFKCDPLTSAVTSDPSVEYPVQQIQSDRVKARNFDRTGPSRTIRIPRHAADAPPTMAKRIANIDSRTTTSSTPTPTATIQPGLSTGAKAGIASAAAVGVVLLLAGLVTFHTHRRRRKYGYSRTKSKDGAAELDGHFTVTTWPDRRESSPMILDERRGSEVGAVGLGIEHTGGLISPGLSTGGLISPGLSTGGHTPIMNDSRFNVSAVSQEHYESTADVSYASTAPLIQPEASVHTYTPPAQSYQSPFVSNQTRSPEIEEDPFEQHNQRSRPSHPLSLLSEAIPPPPLEARARHSMADYQNAVPLGFANGFVQVDRGSRRNSIDSVAELQDHGESSRRAELHGNGESSRMAELQGNGESSRMAELQGNGDSYRRAELAADEVDGPDGDPTLPPYVEPEGMEQPPDEKRGSRRRETVRYDASTAHYHIDSESESEAEDVPETGTGKQKRREFTKEELG